MVTHGRQPNPIDCQTAFGERVLALLALGSEARLVRLNQLLVDLLSVIAGRCIDAIECLGRRTALDLLTDG